MNSLIASMLESQQKIEVEERQKDREFSWKQGNYFAIKTDQ